MGGQILTSVTVDDPRTAHSVSPSDEPIHFQTRRRPSVPIRTRTKATIGVNVPHVERGEERRTTFLRQENWVGDQQTEPTKSSISLPWKLLDWEPYIRKGHVKEGANTSSPQSGGNGCPARTFLSEARTVRSGSLWGGGMEGYGHLGETFPYTSVEDSSPFLMRKSMKYDTSSHKTQRLKRAAGIAS